MERSPGSVPGVVVEVGREMWRCGLARVVCVVVEPVGLTGSALTQTYGHAIPQSHQPSPQQASGDAPPGTGGGFQVLLWLGLRHALDRDEGRKQFIRSTRDRTPDRLAGWRPSGAAAAPRIRSWAEVPLATRKGRVSETLAARGRPPLVTECITSGGTTRSMPSDSLGCSDKHRAAGKREEERSGSCGRRSWFNSVPSR
jgi:hypothetical protein